MKTPQQYLPDFEPPEVDIVSFQDRSRRARKEHTCSVCKRTIAKGETYHYSFYLLDGEPKSDKCCDRCMCGEFYEEEE